MESLKWLNRSCNNSADLGRMFKTCIWIYCKRDNNNETNWLAVYNKSSPFHSTINKVSTKTLHITRYVWPLCSFNLDTKHIIKKNYSVFLWLEISYLNFDYKISFLIILISKAWHMMMMWLKSTPILMLSHLT